MSFAKFSLDELESGVLLEAFASGKAAAIIECRELVESLWSMLLHDPSEKLPWELPLIDIARNHLRGEDLPSTLGDVFYFQPGHHSYIGRKFEISRFDKPKVSPSTFHQGAEQVSPSEELVNLCCAFADKVMLSLSAPARAVPAYKVAVQRLKYQGEWSDYLALAGLIEDSLARWGRKGYALDVLRSQVGPPLERKGVSDAAALLMMAAGAGRRSKTPRATFSGHRKPSNSAEHIYEHSHVDFRYFTALCGWRENVRTEVLSEGKWIELPVDLDSIAIYPGTMFARTASGSATIHRVVHTGSSEAVHGRTSNVTILLGAT